VADYLNNKNISQSGSNLCQAHSEENTYGSRQKQSFSSQKKPRVAAQIVEEPTKSAYLIKRTQEYSVQQSDPSTSNANLICFKNQVREQKTITQDEQQVLLDQCRKRSKNFFKLEEQRKQSQLGDNINFSQFSTYLANFVNSERYSRLQEKFNHANRAQKNVSLSKLLLTPWNEKQLEFERIKCLNQISQVSQGNNHKNQLRSILQKIIGGTRNDQFLSQSKNLVRMGLSEDI
jgi:hypothetical protein